MTSQENIHSFQSVQLKKYCFEIMYILQGIFFNSLTFVVLQFIFVLKKEFEYMITMWEKGFLLTSFHH